MRARTSVEMTLDLKCAHSSRGDARDGRAGASEIAHTANIGGGFALSGDKAARHGLIAPWVVVGLLGAVLVKIKADCARSPAGEMLEAESERSAPELHGVARGIGRTRDIGGGSSEGN